jgi:hypothetical protein
MLDLETNKELNLMGPNNFHFVAQELPKVSLFTSTFNMPGCNLGRAVVPTSNVDYDVPGDKLVFEDLTISFLVNEFMQNYMEVFNWMAALGFPQSSDQFKRIRSAEVGNLQVPFDKEHYQYTETSDILLTITSNKFNPIIKVNFVDCFPVDLSQLAFTNTDPTITPVTADVTFDYSYYYFEPIHT